MLTYCIYKFYYKNNKLIFFNLFVYFTGKKNLHLSGKNYLQFNIPYEIVFLQMGTNGCSNVTNATIIIFKKKSIKNKHKLTKNNYLFVMESCSYMAEWIRTSEGQLIRIKN